MGMMMCMGRRARAARDPAEERICRTTAFLRAARRDLRKSRPHVCNPDACDPKNAAYYASVETCKACDYDMDVYLCMYDRVHVCSEL